jgi:hypothetical protein
MMVVWQKRKERTPKVRDLPSILAPNTPVVNNAVYSCPPQGMPPQKSEEIEVLLIGIKSEIGFAGQAGTNPGWTGACGNCPPAL